MAVDALAQPPASEPLKKSDFNNGESADDRRLKKQCVKFEGILLEYMFKSMQQTVGEGGIFGKSFQRQMYQSMFIQKVSASLAGSSGLGLADQLYRQETGRPPKGTQAPDKVIQNQNDSKEIKGSCRYREHGTETRGAGKDAAADLAKMAPAGDVTEGQGAQIWKRRL
jgi:Rod binding domain-containing protein